jgi:hypothetical protein
MGTNRMEGKVERREKQTKMKIKKANEFLSQHTQK